MRQLAIKTAAGLILCLALCGSLRADTVTVGTPNAANCYPFLCNDSGVATGQSILYQQVYGASNFSGPFEIDSLTFLFAPSFGGSGTVLNGNYTISFSYTGAAVGGLSTDLGSNIGAGSAVFFSGSLGGTLGNPSFTINGTPFIYDPANGNLLMTITVTNQQTLVNPSDRGYDVGDSNGDTTSRAYVLGPGSTGGVTDGMGLVTQFTGPTTDPPTAVAPEPASLLLISTGLLILGGRARKLLNLKR
jgi:hypothetical protein